MSREIKFRDWNPETKEMRYFNLDGYDREVHDAYGNIMQFTGLLDKNGKEIFEGDVIKIIMKDCVLLDEVYWSKPENQQKAIDQLRQNEPAMRQLLIAVNNVKGSVENATNS